MCECPNSYLHPALGFLRFNFKTPFFESHDEAAAAAGGGGGEDGDVPVPRCANRCFMATSKFVPNDRLPPALDGLPFILNARA